MKMTQINVALKDIKPHREGPVTLKEREGVFAHFLKCGFCQAEIVALSWRLDRPAEVDYKCPECYDPLTPIGSVILSRRRTFSLDGVEIHSIGRILADAAEPAPEPLDA